MIMSKKLNFTSFKKRITLVTFVLLLFACIPPVPVYAGNNNNDNDNNNNNNSVVTQAAGFDQNDIDHLKDTNIEPDTSKVGSESLSSIFSTNVWSGTKLQSGLAIAKPFVKIIMTLSVAIVCIIAYLFFGTTALDLAYITVPAIRPLLMKQKENSMGGGGSGLKVISDVAVDAVEGRGSKGGMGGGGDRGTGSCLMTYISSRTVEFIVFVIFVMMFFTGILGNLVNVIFNLFYSLLEGILSLG